MSSAIAIPTHQYGDGRSSSHSDLSPTHSELAKSAPIAILGHSGPASSSKADPEASRHVRLARKAESARAARLRHKQYVTELHEQMLLLNMRTRELERQANVTEEAGLTRTLALIKSSLTPEQASLLSQWLKQGRNEHADLASAFESCRLEDALLPVPHQTAAGAAELRALAAASAAGAAAAAAAVGGGIASSLPSNLGMSHLDAQTARFGSLGDGGIAENGGGHAGGGPLRGRHGTAPIAIGGRARANSLRNSQREELSFPMESDDELVHSHGVLGTSFNAGGATGGRTSAVGSVGVGSLGAGGSSLPSRHAASLSRSWDDIESAQAILSLHGFAAPPHANSYNMQSMDLQFQ